MQGKPAYHRSLGNFQNDVHGRPFFYHRTMHKFKTSTNVTARSLLPTLITESLTSELMMKELYHESDIQDQHPNEPFDWRLALHGDGVFVATECSHLHPISQRAVEYEAEQESGLSVQIGPCNSTANMTLHDIVAIPASWFSDAVPQGVDAAYVALGDILSAYS